MTSSTSNFSPKKRCNRRFRSAIVKKTSRSSTQNKFHSMSNEDKSVNYFLLCLLPSSVLSKGISSPKNRRILTSLTCGGWGAHCLCLDASKISSLSIPKNFSSFSREWDLYFWKDSRRCTWRWHWWMSFDHSIQKQTKIN